VKSEIFNIINAALTNLSGVFKTSAIFTNLLIRFIGWLCKVYRLVPQDAQVPQGASRWLQCPDIVKTSSKKENI